MKTRVGYILVLVVSAMLCATSAMALSGNGGGGSGSGGPPSGAAGGDLGGTYPNPTVVSGANILGVIGKVNARGTITTGNSFDCDMSLGNICTASAASGAAITVNVPTNGVINVQYYLIVQQVATNATLAFGTGWVIWDPISLTDLLPGALVLPKVANGISVTPFHFDGTHYRIDGDSDISAQNINAGRVTIGANGIILSGALVAGTFALTTTTGAIGPLGGGVLQSYGGTAPTLTAGCNGAGATVVTGTNTAGHFTTQTAAATTCTLTFSASGAFHAAPDCMFYDDNADATPVAFSTGAVSTATAVVDFTSLTAVQIGYICIGH